MKLEYSLVPMDSDIFGFPVARIASLELAADEPASENFRGFEAWRDRHAVRLVYCRLHHLRLRESMFLETRGFRFVETVYRPRFEQLQSVAFGDQGLQIRAAAAEDLPEIEAIAQSAFATGRYVLDGRLDAALGHRRYGAWAHSAYEHPTQRLFEAVSEGRIVGFFVTETLPGNCCYWHLTAVAPGVQGQGFGRRIWQSMMLLHKAQGIETIETCVSGHNVRVLNLYSALRFRLTDAEMTFHWIREE
jgi:ribosomal protein S18 acetylase RimI-like enzyme